MRTLHHQLTINTHHPSKTCSLGCALYIISQQSTPNTQAKHVPSDAHFFIITQQSTPNNQAKHVPSDAHFTSSPNNQHPTTKPNMFPRMRTLHHHRTINTQQPSQTCSLGCALYIITEQSTPNTQTKHVPSDAHFTSSPNNQHPSPRQNMFPQMRTLHHQPTVNTHHPTAMSVIQ